jgi:arylsulfatase
MNSRNVLIAGAWLTLLCACAPSAAPAPESVPAARTPGAMPEPAVRPPNILLIVADDLGYSDLGIYGGEIRTPNLDALARGGVRFTQFYASPMCSPTRAMLLTGIDHHPAGLGNLVERLSDNQQGQPGYEGHLNSRVATLAEILRDWGYRTYMAGKWHLGSGPGQDPSQRGFERTFALLESGAGHFQNMLPLLGPGQAEYSEDGARLEALPERFYSSRFYVRRMIDYLQGDQGDERPFFGYLAFTAPHFPLQAPAESIARYRGRYDRGYDAIHAERLQRMRQLGLVPENVRPFPQLASEPPWSELTVEERSSQARLMEIYAAMIDDLDRYTGELIDFLKAHGLYENTVIFFLSDNGAEGHYLHWGLDPLVPWAERCCDNSLANMGHPDSYLMLGPRWARVSTAPFRMFKGFTSEGGVRVPAFVHFPQRFAGGRISRSLATVKDVMPTLLALAGSEHPGTRFGGREVLPMQGESMLALLQGTTARVHDPDFYIAWEMFGKRGVRSGDWKILWETADARWWDTAALGIRRNSWQLYDLAGDPAEMTDLSAAQPQRLEAMIELWERYARDNGVIIPDRQRGY